LFEHAKNDEKLLLLHFSQIHKTISIDFQKRIPKTSALKRMKE